jgi:hypothetical protein
MNKYMYVGIIILVLLAAGYAVFYYYALNKGEANPKHQLFYSAATEFGELLNAGKVPGISRGEHGNVSNSGYPIDDHDIEYPFNVDMNVTKTNDGEFTYRYTMQKKTPDSSWVLVRAVKTNKTGIMQEIK